jgi:hypothetical protein
MSATRRPDAEPRRPPPDRRGPRRIPLLDIDMIDHIVLAGDRFVSLRDRGVTFAR